MSDLAATIARLGLIVESEFVPFSKSRNAAEKHRSLNWRVTLKREGRDILTTDYSAGIAHCPAYKASVREAGGPNCILRHEAIERETETGVATTFAPSGIAMMQRGAPILPDATDVIYSLVRDSDVLDFATFEQWAEEFGYDTDSRSAESTYRACLEIALKLRAGIGEADLSALREAASEY